MSKTMLSLVKEYLLKTNRPFSANDIFNNLNSKDNKLSKTAVIRAVEELASNQLIIEKLNGKQKIYFVDQKNFSGIDENQIRELDQLLDSLNPKSKQLENEVKQKSSKLCSLKTKPTFEELSQQKSQLNEEIQRLNNKLETIESLSKGLDQKKNQKVKNERQTHIKAWIQRKRLFADILAKVLDNYSKPKQEFIEELGIETDEQLAVVLPQI